MLRHARYDRSLRACIHLPPRVQVFYCWSKRCDAVLEVECTGRWREAYDTLRALGVTDQELVGSRASELLGHRLGVLQGVRCCWAQQIRSW